MPTFYKIDKHRKLVMTTYSGVLTITDALGHQAKLLKDPDFDPSFSQLFDVTHVTDAQQTSDDIRRLAQTTVFSPDSSRAILVSNVFREDKGEKGIRVFRNLDDALDWVLGRSRE